MYPLVLDEYFCISTISSFLSDILSSLKAGTDAFGNVLNRYLRTVYQICIPGGSGAVPSCSNTGLINAGFTRTPREVYNPVHGFTFSVSSFRPPSLASPSFQAFSESHVRIIHTSRMRHSAREATYGKACPRLCY